MKSEPPHPSGPESHLSRISTRWPLLGDMSLFVLCYGRAIRKYIHTILGNPLDAEEAEQDFLVRVLQRGFANASPDRGRFRDYLKTAVRNAMLTWMERKKRGSQREVRSSEIDIPEEASTAGDQAWIAEWQRCILDRAWRALEGLERKEGGSHYHRVLRLAADHPQEDSPALAARVPLPGGGSMRADAFRKQLSRARRLFAELVVKEVAKTIEEPTRDRVMEELTETGLLHYVQGFLPPDWDPRPASSSKRATR